MQGASPTPWRFPLLSTPFLSIPHATLRAPRLHHAERTRQLEWTRTGRTSKTAAGAHRRSVIVSVLESLRTNLAAFNLESVLEEVSRWMTEGLSLFARQWHEVMGASARTALDTG